MRRLIPIFVLAVAAMVALAQTTDTVPQGGWHNGWRHKADPARPIAAEGGGLGPARSLEFRTPEQMTREDRDVEADGEAAIAEKAGFQGLEFNQGNWSYRQIVCPAFPRHLFLQFSRNDGTHERSMFAASIPRAGAEGRVRIVPIERRGYSLFSPAPINKLTLQAFNHILKEEGAARLPDWFELGLCYAALAGARPLAPASEDPQATKSGDRAGAPASLILPVGGGAEIRFADVAVPERPTLWTMRFNGAGLLEKATHVPAPSEPVRDWSPAAIDEKGTPMNPAPVDERGKPIQ